MTRGRRYIAAYLFMGLTSFVATKFVIYMFTEYYLPVLLVVFNIIELTIIFDGIGQAITPIVNVYRGEENSMGIKRIMKTALLYAIAEGLIWFIYLRYGKEKFPLLLDKETKTIQIFDTELSEENVMKLRDSVADYLAKNNVSSASINRIMLLIEETCMDIYENNKQRKVSLECSIMIGSEVQMIIRDDGGVRDITDSDVRITSFRTYILSQLMARTSDKQNLVTTGYNRNVFRFNI